MAESFYKSLDIGKDVVATRTLLHEAIPLTGTIISGTYGDDNIKNYAHGMFQSVYDYPYLSSSANHIFDITVGVGAESALHCSPINRARSLTFTIRWPKFLLDMIMQDLFKDLMKTEIFLLVETNLTMSSSLTLLVFSQKTKLKRKLCIDSWCIKFICECYEPKSSNTRYLWF